jgi:hypothetical protein
VHDPVKLDPRSLADWLVRGVLVALLVLVGATYRATIETRSLVESLQNDVALLRAETTSAGAPRADASQAMSPVAEDVDTEAAPHRGSPQTPPADIGPLDCAGTVDVERAMESALRKQDDLVTCLMLVEDPVDGPLRTLRIAVDTNGAVLDARTEPEGVPAFARCVRSAVDTWPMPPAQGHTCAWIEIPIASPEGSD